MEWFNKFRVGQKVKVVKKVLHWKFPDGGGCSWNKAMDVTIGKSYRIVEINKFVGYKLHTELFTDYEHEKYDYWFPVEAFQPPVGQQLLFNFMHEE